MPAPKGNTNAKGNKGGPGRESLFKSEYANIALSLSLLGATDADMAIAFGVCETTINAWKKAHVEFYEALKKGKIQADAIVAKSLYNRALGYEHKAVKIVADAKTGMDHKVEYVERYPPDTTAAIFWLKNRQPKLWRDKVEQEITHAGAVGVLTGEQAMAVVTGFMESGDKT